MIRTAGRIRKSAICTISVSFGRASLHPSPRIDDPVVARVRSSDITTRFTVFESGEFSLGIVEKSGNVR